ncbi:MAG TPA: LacI family DNA-binding transcriptional regulator [Phototrophicaceae bacterium]|nr:LacI family DNA-binding transcriptional regulator [Phototrophicaceae bacterium]
MPKKHVTISDVADKAGVSKMTVSRVINHKGEISATTRQRVLDAMQELGFRPNRIAKRLATNATCQIGIVVPSISNQYFGAIIEGAEQFLWEHDYQILLCHTGGDPARQQAIMRILEDNRVDGVIVLSAHSSGEAMSRALANQRAAVAINTNVTPGVATCIFTDEIKSMALAVHHLMANGRRHLGYIGFEIDTYASHERRRGFDLALHQAGLVLDAPKQCATIPTQFGPDTNAIIGQLLTSNPKLDALVCFNTAIAAKALQTCTELNRHIPNDIAILGYDDDLIAELMTPPLTAVELEIPKQDVGALAAHLLLQHLKDRNSQPEDVILHHKLVVRSSAP